MPRRVAAVIQAEDGILDIDTERLVLYTRHATDLDLSSQLHCLTWLMGRFHIAAYTVAL